VAVIVSFGIEDAARRGRRAAEAARRLAEADRLRTALLAAVSHDAQRQQRVTASGGRPPCN
jgi:K+-sensing histidine kinase KdpD